MNYLRMLECWVLVSNPTRGKILCVCVYSVCVIMCVGSDIAKG
jgi:hypothetical protein